MRGPDSNKIMWFGIEGITFSFNLGFNEVLILLNRGDFTEFPRLRIIMILFTLDVVIANFWGEAGGGCFFVRG